MNPNLAIIDSGLRNATTIWKEIESTDLEPIIFKLVYEEGWSLEYALQIACLYRAYLFLVNTHDSVVPTKAIDKFWHAHILDTKKYMADCERIFGRYIHHFPYFGMRDEQDAENLAKQGEKSAKLFEQVFGVNVRQLSQNNSGEHDASNAMCDNAGCGMCGSEDGSCGSEVTTDQIMQPQRRPRLANLHHTLVA